MTVAKNLRSSDILEVPSSDVSGFAIRKRSTAAQVIDYLILLIVLIGGTSALVYSETMVGCAIVVALGAILFGGEYRIRNLTRSKRSTEFMNALFSSAMSRDSKFVAIAKLDGSIVYLNRDFQSLFPAFLAQDTRNIQVLLGQYKVPTDQQEKLLGLIQGNNEGTATIAITAEGGSAQTLNVTVEPIARPVGFALLRGK